MELLNCFYSRSTKSIYLTLNKLREWNAWTLNFVPFVKSPNLLNVWIVLKYIFDFKCWPLSLIRCILWCSFFKDKIDPFDASLSYFGQNLTSLLSYLIVHWLKCLLIRIRVGQFWYPPFNFFFFFCTYCNFSLIPTSYCSENLFFYTFIYF